MRRTLLLALTSASAISCGGNNSLGTLPDKDTGPPSFVDDAGSTSDPVGCGCSDDLHSVIGCLEGAKGVLKACAPDQACDVDTFTCKTACEANDKLKRSTGCDFYTAEGKLFPIELLNGINAASACFTAFVVNGWSGPAHLSLEYDGKSYPLAQFAKIQKGTLDTIQYDAYSEDSGLAPGETAIIFLAGVTQTSLEQIWLGYHGCPFDSAIGPHRAEAGSAIAPSFHVSSDVPVAAYHYFAYSGPYTGATLLLPTNAWGTKYIGIDPAPEYQLLGADLALPPAMNIFAAQDNTTVTVTPSVPLQASGLFADTDAGVAVQFVLNQGEQAQLSQTGPELTGSVISADKPVGVISSAPVLGAGLPVAPTTIESIFEPGSQMLPPLQALGSEYVGVKYRKRHGEPMAVWRLVGAAAGTTLQYVTGDGSTIDGAPATLQQGESQYFQTGTPFTVKSQDDAHPFSLFTYMPVLAPAYVESCGEVGPDVFLQPPTRQFGKSYTFYADPWYQETNLVIVRAKAGGAFADVVLDCAGPLAGWQTVGDYEWTFADLQHYYQDVGNCSPGTHQITSDAPFSVAVWGWQTELCSITGGNYSAYLARSSYSYPAGMNVDVINSLQVTP